MTRNVRTTFISTLTIVFFLVSIYHNLFSDSSISGQSILQPSPLNNNNVNHAIHETTTSFNHAIHHQTSFSTNTNISTISILFPAWEVLTIMSPQQNNHFPINSIHEDYLCVYPKNIVSPAKPAGNLEFPDRKTFKCEMPVKIRRRLPFPRPVLTTPENVNLPANSPKSGLLRWNFIAYDLLLTENDVVLFVKGVNKRQGMNRDPGEFRCVFGDDLSKGVRTAVKTSMQEVFRCEIPSLTELSRSEPVKASLEIVADKSIVPSVAYFAPSRTLAHSDNKSLLCACTMVYNVAKFLKEWVIYHSKIGVDKFILYDNESGDELNKVIEELKQQGFDVESIFWLWPKTQEAGFSHCAIYAKNSCSWMMYIDVDEFIYSPTWSNSSQASKSLLQSILPNGSSEIGEIMIGCHEFGPSNQKSHPVTGVTQGYNCRRKLQNRHKSIVSLDAIDDSLLNVIHHFTLRNGYRVKKIGIEEMVVNHYKFQAWDEFKAKFRRRVSAYVLDWTQAGNLRSNDRTPGLGFSAVEPKGWPEKFCEVYDNGLKEFNEKWFRVEAPNGYLMAWQ